MSEEEEELEQSKRPKIVDKRISAGGHSPPPKSAPAAEPPPQPAEPKETPPPPSQQQAAPGAAAGEEQVWTPEQEEQARQIIDQIVRTPAIDWVLNSAVNLANVAGTKLEAGQIEDAQLAIDGLAALINGLSGRLQDAEAPLKQTLSQLQLLYAQRAGAVPQQPETDPQ